MEVFQSIHHPGSAPLALVIARAQAQPVALALIGVMVVTLSAVLRGLPVLHLLLWAAPLAYAAAASWSVYELHRRPAELVIRGGFGAKRSVWEVARDHEQSDAYVTIRLHPLFEPGKKDGQWHVGVGDDVVSLRPSEWPRYDELIAALRRAAAELQGATSPI